MSVTRCGEKSHTTNSRRQASPRAKTVLQFRVALLGITPTIWRRVLVPEDYTFWGLHLAIQDAMGWLDYHLHEFCALDLDAQMVSIGIPDDEFDDHKLSNRAGRSELQGFSWIRGCGDLQI